ncbi:MAG: (d)CMP kinase [Halobacteriovoraceae bacterium]|nr:(d)CMP kinase [Halobacteriovoraceae bacterium]
MIEKVVAIDGPGGSGKSTIAKKLADSLKFMHVDTGALYRALGLVANRDNIPFENDQVLQDFLNNLKIEYCPTPEILIRVNGENLTQLIRDHEVSSLASQISQLPLVREFLLEFQRQLPGLRTCVMEGRDIGSIVFPNAFCKIFLTANLETRTERRFLELKDKGELDIDREMISEDIKIRDLADMNRKVAPLVQTDDAIYLDTSELNEEQVLQKLKEFVKMKALEHNLTL